MSVVMPVGGAKVDEQGGKGLSKY